MNYQTELHACVLCHDAPCTGICPDMEPERLFQAAKLNSLEAYLAGKGEASCSDCGRTCAMVCPKGVAVGKLVQSLYSKKAEWEAVPHTRADLSCEICYPPPHSAASGLCGLSSVPACLPSGRYRNSPPPHIYSQRITNPRSQAPGIALGSL